MAACQVDPADAMLVAAHPWDTDGAHRAGLASAWIDRCGSRYSDYFLPLDLEAAARPRAERSAIIRAIEIFIAPPVSAQSASPTQTAPARKLFAGHELSEAGPTDILRRDPRTALSIVR
jgi:hypothetical protein